MMVWIDDKAFWFVLPAFDDVFIRSGSSQGFEPAWRSYRHSESVEMFSQLLMIVVMIAFDGCFFESTVHALDLAIGPGMIGPDQAMFHTIFQIDAIEAM